MRKALYISSSPDEHNVGQEDNRWHCFDTNDTEQQYTVKNEIPEDRFMNYLGNMTEDALVFLADKSSVGYLSNERFGNRRKEGMIYVYTNPTEFSKIKIAEYIGCALPKSLREKLNPPYYKRGKNIEEYLKLNPNDLGWFKCSDQYQDIHDFKSVIVPILDKLISLLLKKEDNPNYKRLLLTSKESSIIELGQLLKRILISLPLGITNLLSFNTNASGYEALTDIDIACVSNIDELNIPENKLDCFELVDAKINVTDFSPMTISGKYILEQEKNLAKFKMLTSSTAKDLEADVSDIMLLELCKGKVDFNSIHKIRELYDSASNECKERVKTGLTKTAYCILLSKDYFQIDKADIEFLSAFLTKGIRLSFTRQNLYVAIVEAIRNASGDSAGAYLKFLFDILNNHEMIAIAENVLKDILYKGEWIDASLETSAKDFLLALDAKFESYLCNVPNSPNEQLKVLIKSLIFEKYQCGKDRIALYLRVREKTDCSWLAESVFGYKALCTFDDLEQWKVCYDELGPNARCLNVLFASVFKEFLNGIDFNQSADEVYKKIGRDNLELIRTTAEAFEYKQDDFAVQLGKIDDIKRRNDSLNVMLYRRCKLILDEYYPTDKSQKKLFKKCDESEEKMMNEIITKRSGVGYKKKGDRKKDSNGRLFFKGLSPSFLLPFICLILITLVMYFVSVDGYGWILFSSILGTSVKYLQIGFYAATVVLYSIVYGVSAIMGIKKDINEKIVASKAFSAAVIMFLLPCIGMSLFMRLIG